MFNCRLACERMVVMDMLTIIEIAVLSLFIFVFGVFAYRAGYRKGLFISEPVGILHIDTTSADNETIGLELKCTLPQLQDCKYIILAVENAQEKPLV